MIFSRYLPEPVVSTPDRDSIPPPAQEFPPSRSPSTSIRWLGGPGRRFSLLPPSRRLRPRGGRHLAKNIPRPIIRRSVSDNSGFPGVWFDIRAGITVTDCRVEDVRGYGIKL